MDGREEDGWADGRMDGWAVSELGRGSERTRTDGHGRARRGAGCAGGHANELVSECVFVTAATTSLSSEPF